MFAFASAFGSFGDRLTGVAIALSGGVLVVTARGRLPGLLLLASGASWLLPVVSGGPVSTLYVHRALLVAAFAVAVEPVWRRTATIAPLLLFGAVAASQNASVSGEGAATVASLRRRMARKRSSVARRLSRERQALMTTC